MTATALEPGTLAQLDPSTLLLERNIRETTVDDDLVASIKAVGVLEPVVVVLNDAGEPVIRFGHRRVLAAVAAGRDAVPVYVAGTDDLADSAEIDRIVRQHDENTHRRQLTAGEQIGVVEQLSMFGLTPAQITKRARIPRSRVDAAMVTSQSKLAREAANRYEALTLDQAAAVVEFEDDPETAKALIVTAIDQPEKFAHVLQEQRDERAEGQRRAAAVAKLAATGVQEVDPPRYDEKAKPLDRLRQGGKKIDAEAHASCPGHVAWVAETGGWIDKATGAEANIGNGIDQTTMDWGSVFRVEYGCVDPLKHGHVDSWSPNTKPKAADLPEKEREAEKKKRRLVIDNNKAWVSATKVRRDWLAQFAGQPKAPAGAAAFIARTIGANSYALQDYQGSGLAADWLKATSGQTNGRAVAAAAANAKTEARALQITLVLVLAYCEAQLNQGSWRQDGKTSDAGAFLRFLESAGYGLSDVEKFAISSRTA